MKNSSNNRMDGRYNAGRQEAQYPTEGQMGNPNSDKSQSAQINSTNASSNAGVNNTSRYSGNNIQHQDDRMGMGRSQSTRMPSNPSSSTLDSASENYAEGARRSAQEEINSDRSSYGTNDRKNDMKSQNGYDSSSKNMMHGEQRTDSRETSSAQQNIRSGSQYGGSQSSDSQSGGSYGSGSQSGMGSQGSDSQKYGSKNNMGSYDTDSQKQGNRGSMDSNGMNRQNKDSQDSDSKSWGSADKDSQNKW